MSEITFALSELARRDDRLREAEKVVDAVTRCYESVACVSNQISRFAADDFGGREMIEAKLKTPKEAEEGLDGYFYGFSADDPTLLDYVALKFELKRLAQAQADLAAWKAKAEAYEAMLVNARYIGLGDRRLEKMTESGKWVGEIYRNNAVTDEFSTALEAFAALESASHTLQEGNDGNNN